MPSLFSRSVAGPRSAALAEAGDSYITILTTAGAGVLLFTLMAGFFVYSNTKSLVVAKDWVQHAQEVLTSLQTASLLVDRIEFSERLYTLDEDENQLNTAYLSAIGLESVALRLHMLVSDNAGQTHSSQTLTACAGSVRNEVFEPEKFPPPINDRASWLPRSRQPDGRAGARVAEITNRKVAEQFAALAYHGVRFCWLLTAHTGGAL